MKLFATFASLAFASNCLNESTEMDQVKCMTKELSSTFDLFKGRFLKLAQKFRLSKNCITNS